MAPRRPRPGVEQDHEVVLGRQVLDALPGSLQQQGVAELQADRVDIWFRNVVNGEDQLRQRVAFALSEILVVSQLGALVNAGVGHMESAAWTLLIPAALLALILMCFNFLGDGLRDHFDARKAT